MNTATAPAFATTYGRAPFVKAEASVRAALVAFRMASDATREAAKMDLYMAQVRMECVGTGNAADEATRFELLNTCRQITL